MNTLIHEAEEFLVGMLKEGNISVDEKEKRLLEIVLQIKETGTYVHTYEELLYGARTAWRNSSRCIGRLFWKSLSLLDFRYLKQEDEIFDALLHHIQLATNDGQIKPIISIFHPGDENFTIKIWNHQLIRYAGYETDNGVVGDSGSIAFTKICQQLGWSGSGTPYDILPLVIQLNDRTPVFREIPLHLVKQVKIEHPHFPWFKQLGLQWYAVPIVSDMSLELGGIRYTAAPFNGWYMVTEIGSRHFGDEDKYYTLPAVAKGMGLDTSSNQSFWKDKAIVELNVAVLHSYRKNKVSIVDHHSASEQFMTFCKQEKAQGREVNARWSWIIPPLSPSTTKVWHTGMKEFPCKPQYEKQKRSMELEHTGLKCPFHQ